MKNLVKLFVADDQGQDLIEYALLGGFVSLAAVVGARALGTGLSTWYSGLGASIAAIDVTP